VQPQQHGPRCSMLEMMQTQEPVPEEVTFSDASAARTP